MRRPLRSVLSCVFALSTLLVPFVVITRAAAPPDQARITAVAHGGQIVVSANTREAVRSTNGAGVRFVALGTHQLRGLPEPVALFQVGSAGLPSRFPPLRTG